MKCKGTLLRKSIAVLVSLMMLFTFMPTVAFADDTGDAIKVMTVNEEKSQLELGTEAKYIEEPTQNVIGEIKPNSGDFTAPVVDVSTLKVDKSKVTAGDTVKVSVKITDEGSGVDSAKITYKSSLSDKRKTSELEYNSDTGLYEGSIEITETMESCVWQIAYINAEDNAGNCEYVNNSTLTHFSGVDLSSGNFEVTGTNGDITEPVIDVSTLKVDKSKVTAGDTVKVSVKVTDEGSGVDRATISYKSPLSNKNKEVSLKYNSDTGLYEGSLEIVDTMESCVWQILYIYAEDNAGNFVLVDNIQTNSSGVDLSSGNFEVTGTNGDITAPIIDVSTLKVDKSKVTAGDTVKVSVKVTDEGSGLKSVDIRYESPLSYKRKLVSLKYNSDTGLYEGSLEIVEAMESRVWDIEFIFAEDYAGNRVFIENSKNINEGVDLSSGEFEVTEEMPQLVETKLVGSDRYATAVLVSNNGWDKCDNVVLVNSMAMADALCATPFAKSVDAPILLTQADKLNETTKAEIKRLGAKNVYAIGGTGVISESVVKEIKSLGINVERISGADRYATSLEIANRLNGVSNIAVVNGLTGLADAVSIAPVAARDNMAILLTYESEGSVSLNKYLSGHKINKVYVIGGQGAVSDKLVKDIANKERLGGSNRNETNSKIIGRFYTEEYLNNIFIAKDGAANENQLIDALSVGVLAAKEESPVLIVRSEGLSDTQLQLVETKYIYEITQVGGYGNENAFKQVVENVKNN